MSIRLMTMVFDAGGLTPSQKLILLAMADHANDDGLSIYPSLQRLSIKTGLVRNTLKANIKILVQKELLETVQEATPRFPKEYRINIDVLKGMKDTQWEAFENRRSAKKKGVSSCPPGGQQLPPRGSAVAPESLYNHQRNKGNSSKKIAQEISGFPLPDGI